MPTGCIRPAGAVFDCDGTLTDTMGLWYQIESSLAARAGYEITEEDADVLRGLTLPESGAWFHERLGLGTSAEDVVATIESMACDYYATAAKARPGAVEFVRAISEAGVVCAIASSSPHSMLDPGIVCAGFGIWIPRERIVSVDDVGMSKLKPAVYDEARRRIGSPKDATWVFEDAVYAVRTARNGGYPVMGVYDNDGSGTLSELASEADAAVADWGAVDVERFLAGGYRG